MTAAINQKRNVAILQMALCAGLWSIAGIFINSPLWILYDIIVGSWAGVVDELVSEASMLLSVYRYGWKNLDRVEE